MSPGAMIFLVLGLALLIAGAELLVRGASRLALRFGLSPLLIGLTVVAFGTSAPELAVSVQAGLAGQADIAAGNIVGSNIFNVLFILGLAALILPLAVSQQLVRLDVPLMIGASLLFWIMALDGRIGRFDGLLLLAGIVAYTLFAIRQGRKESPEIQAEYAQEFGAAKDGWLSRLPVQLALIAAGLALLVLGATWLVDSAVAIARVLGVSEVVIGLTIIAAGTSLPEVATSIVAALRGERDIAVGNVVGSNLFNLLGIGGIAALVTPGGLEVAASLVRLDLPVMAAVAFACLPIFATGHLIARWEGALFAAYYAAYVAYLILVATHHAALPPFSGVMLGFVLPITVVTLAVLWTRNKFLGTGEPGYHPLRKLAVVLAGLRYAVLHDFSVLYKAVLSVLVLGLALWLHAWVDAGIILLATGVVLAAELFNTAIEALCDLVETRHDEKIRIVKDIAAAATGVAILAWAIVLAVNLVELWSHLAAPPAR